MIERTVYLQQLLAWKDEPLIKVVTGIRRSGKSTLLQQYQAVLRQEGVAEEQMIAINLEDLRYEDLLEYHALYAYIEERLDKNRPSYIFIDEIQKVPAFEKALDSLYIKPNVDIYVTGSNAFLLSGELATLLSGRYVEIALLPLSFKEYTQATALSGDEAFAEYLRTGGFPYVATMQRTDEKVDMYLEGIYNTIIVRDIEDRSLRSTLEARRGKINDVTLLKAIAKYLASVVGSPVSTRSITNYLVSSGRKISPNTVSQYLEALTEAFIFYDADRMDLAGKQLLKTNKKYYIVDLGLRNHILPKRQYDLGFSIENIVYFELLRRGYKAYVGRSGDYEIDFVTQKQGALAYYQVTADMSAQETFDRELRPLKALKDNYPKVVLTLSRFGLGNYEGIEVKNLVDWLLADEVTR